MILKYVCPDYRVKSLFDISAKWLKRNGYTKIVVDIDNTLLPRDKNLVGPRAMTWIRQLHQMGINVALISNNGGDRIKGITRQTGLGTMMRAAKPLPMAYKQITKAMGGGKILFQIETARQREDCLPAGADGFGQRLAVGGFRS